MEKRQEKNTPNGNNNPPKQTNNQGKGRENPNDKMTKSTKNT